MVYFIVFLLLLFGIYYYDYRKNSSTELAAMGLMCLFFIAIAGLRYRLGNDSVIYEASYQSMPTLSDLRNFKFGSTRYEPGYVVFNSIPRTFSSDFTYFQIFHALVVNLVVFWFVLRNTQNKFIALLLYYIGLYVNLNMEVLREALAVCCFLLAWPFLREGKWIFYYMLAILASTFHISGMITLLLPIFAIPGVRRLFRLGPQTLVVCLLVFALSMVVQRKFFGIIEMISSNDTITERADVYSKNSLGALRLNLFGMTEHLLKTVFIPVLALYYMKRMYLSRESSMENKEWIRKIEILVVTGFYFSIVAIAIPIAGRFNNYIGMFNIILISSCIFTTVRIRKKRLRLSGALWTAILIFICLVNFKLYFEGTHGSSTLKVYQVYYPYESRLDPKDNYDREVIFRRFKHFH